MNNTSLYERSLRHLRALRNVLHSYNSHDFYPDEEALLSDLEAAIAEQQADERDQTSWRDLALQFDYHRMQALGHLKALVESQSHASDARAFLFSTPLSGQAVLETRLRAIAEQAKPQEPAAYQNSGGIDVITARVRELMSNPRAGSIANNAAKRYTTALYTRPQSLEPMSDADIGLTIDAIDFSQMVTADDYQYLIARAIEAKLGVKK